MKSSPDLRILPDRAALFQAAADEFVRQANTVIASKGRFTVALAGGSTPKGLYSLLAMKAKLAWDKMYFFFGDERHVPPDNPESNYRMAREALLSKVPIPAQNIRTPRKPPRPTKRTSVSSSRLPKPSRAST
jgi:6-phosphogluconolactonase